MRTLLLPFSLLFLSLSLLALASAPARGARATARSIPLYEVQYLGVLPGAPSSVAYGINDLGDVVGYSDYPEQAFIWHEGEGMERLLPILGYTRCHARDINNVGEVAGTCGWELSDEPARATRWDANGSPQNLGTLSDGQFSQAYGINDLGNVTGGSRIGGTGPLIIHAFVYTEDDGMMDITPDANDTVRGYGINNVGPIGEVAGAGVQGFRWRNGSLEWLPEVPGYAYARALAINDHSQMVGTATTDTGNSEDVVRWTDGVGWEILGGVGDDNAPRGMNDAGWVVGAGRPGPGPVRAFIYTDESGMQDLNQYLATPGWFIGTANDINDAGMIVGYGSHSSGIVGAVRLVPVTGGPTPSATATSAPPTSTATATSAPPSSTATSAPPTSTATATSAPPTATATSAPSTPSATASGVPPTLTASPTTPSATPTTQPVPPTWRLYLPLTLESEEGP